MRTKKDLAPSLRGLLFLSSIAVTRLLVRQEQDGMRQRLRGVQPRQVAGVLDAWMPVPARQRLGLRAVQRPAPGIRDQGATNDATAVGSVALQELFPFPSANAADTVKVSFVPLGTAESSVKPWSRES